MHYIQVSAIARDCMGVCECMCTCIPLSSFKWLCMYEYAYAFPLEYVHTCARLLVWVYMCINVQLFCMHEYGCVHIYTCVCAHTCMYTLLWTCVAIGRGVFSVCVLANVVHIKWGSQQEGCRDFYIEAHSAHPALDSARAAGIMGAF